MTFPPDFTHREEKTELASVVAMVIAQLAPARRVVVQAGGCSGLWPLALAKFFDRVVTFEPHPDNFECLRANIATTPTIAAFNAALGARETQIGLKRNKAQAGLWRVDGDGDIPMMRLDDVMGDVPVDALVLDVEGSELAAMEGAERLIARHRPLIWFECVEHVEAIHDFLDRHGYVPPRDGIYLDRYSIHESRVLVGA